jgi:hypothetical protein
MRSAFFQRAWRAWPGSFEAASPQHRLYGNVDGVAHDIGGEHFALQVGDGFDRAIQAP